MRSLTNVAVATDQPAVPLPDAEDAANGEVSGKSLSNMLSDVSPGTYRKLLIGGGLIILAVVLGVIVNSALTS